MSLHPRDPGISNFAIPQLEEMINILVDMNFDSELIFSGGDLSPATLLGAYRSGLFPMPLDNKQLGWFSPQQRGVFITMTRYDGSLPIRVSGSLRKSIRKFSFSQNLAFEEVITRCADPLRSGSWITPTVKQAYLELHEMGWAHSFETWRTIDGESKLAGGLYGIAIGGLFAGESMFHDVTDGSKAALVALTSEMVKGGGLLIDTQWNTAHLASMGAITLSRFDYLNLLEEALSRPLPKLFANAFSGNLKISF